MSTAPLERHCRRLLRFYPADHRAEHEEEMLAVLLADTAPGRSRLSPRTMWDVVAGALRIRLWRAFSALDREAWRDAFALVAAFGAVLLGVDRAAEVGGVLLAGPEVLLGLGLLALAWGGVLAAQLLLAVPLIWAVVAGRRSVAIVMAWAVALLSAGWSVLRTVTAGDVGGLLDPILWLSWLVVVAAMAGPRRPTVVIGGRGLLLFGAAMFVSRSLATMPGVLGPANLIGVTFFLVAVLPITVGAVAAGRAIRSAAGRRATTLLAIPALLLWVWVVLNVLAFSWLALVVHGVVVAVAFAVGARAGRRVRREPAATA